MVIQPTLPFLIASTSPLFCFWTWLAVHPKGDQSWVFIVRTDVEAETPIFWPPDVKSWFIGKDSDAGKDWGQEEKGITEDEMVGWPHRLDRHGFGWTPGVGDGQGGLACCGSWGCKQSDTTEQLDWTGAYQCERAFSFCFFLSLEGACFCVRFKSEVLSLERLIMIHSSKVL